MSNNTGSGYEEHRNSTAAAFSTPEGPLLAAEATTNAGTDLDRDSTSLLGDDSSLSTASVASSIMQYRTIHGRTFHSDKYSNSQYFTPNDDQQQASIDITNHYLTLLLDGALFLAPVPKTVKNVVDIGTGTGIWAIDFGDQFPDSLVTGTDISPIQPAWVPPNTKFEIDDATQPWTWHDDTFGFIHMRYLVGAIADWDALFLEAYRCCEPGGWLESVELDVDYLSDDGTAKHAPVLQTFWELYDKGIAKLGRTARVVKDGIQRKSMKSAGFINIHDKSFKLPVGGWAADSTLAEIGQYVQLALLNDLEGYTTYLWNNVLRWDETEYGMFLMSMRKAMKDRRVHTYYTVRYVWGQKPE